MGVIAMQDKSPQSVSSHACSLSSVCAATAHVCSMSKCSKPNLVGSKVQDHEHHHHQQSMIRGSAPAVLSTGDQGACAAESLQAVHQEGAGYLHMQRVSRRWTGRAQSAWSCMFPGLYAKHCADEVCIA